MLDISLETTIETHNNRAALFAARLLVEDPRRFFTLLGPNGRGKTHIAVALLNGCLARGYSGMYLTTAELLDDLKTTFAPGSQIQASKVLDQAKKVRVLVLDEFDRYNPTAWAETEFFKLVEDRYRNGMERLTVFVSNAPLEDIPAYISSRMRDRRCQIHIIGGPDFRPLLPPEKKG